jgi:hypothetical protein
MTPSPTSRARTQSSSPFSGTGGTRLKPPGTLPPSPNWPLIVARLVVFLCLVLLAARSPLLRWADAQPVRAVTRPAAIAPANKTPTTATAATTRLAATSAHVIHTVLRPPGFVAVWGIGIAGLTAMALELFIAALLLVVQTMRMRGVERTYLRIRTPRTTTLHSTGARSGAGADTFRAVHDMLPTNGMLTGRAPWIACTLVGRPDEPVELGAAIGGDARQRTIVAGSLRKIIVGQAPEAVVDERPDPLTAAIEPGAVVAWCDFSLALSPSYPLRLHSDVEHSDLLGPLAAALTPRAGVRHTEAQIIVRARKDWELTRGWRAAGTRRLLHMKAKQVYAIGDDAATLEDKLNGPVYDTTVRVIAIAQGRQHVSAAYAEIAEAAAVLGQYAARSGSRLQRLRRIGNGWLIVPQQDRRLRGRVLTWLLGIAAAAGCAWVIGRLPESLLHIWSGRWPLLDLPAWVICGAPRSLMLLLPLLLLLSVVALMQRWRGAPAAVRVQHLCARVPRAVPLGAAMFPARAWRGPAILSPSELSGLWHLPTPALGALIRWLPCRQIAAPPHAFVDHQHDRIIIGHARHGDGHEAPVGPTLFDLRQVCHLTAGMGAGKSRALSTICVQLIERGFTLIDGKGDDSGNLVATVRNLIPLEDEGRLVLLDVLDSAWPVGLNPLAGVDLHQAGGTDRVLAQVQAVFARLDPETWGRAPGMQQFLQMGTLLVLEAEPHPTLAHVKQALLDPSYREQLLLFVRNVEVKTFWDVTFPQIGENQRTSRDALLRRFDMLLVPEITRHLVAPVESSLDLLDAIDQHLIVLIPVPHITLGGLASAIGTLIFQAFIRAAFGREGTALERTSYALVVDEFQVLVEHSSPEDLKKALSQLRSQGIPALYAHQALVQLGEVAELMLINAQNRIMLQTQEPDASTYARLYAASGLTAIDISGQDPTEHQYARILCDGKPAGPFSMRPLPWPDPVPANAPPYDGLAWQTVLPDASDPADTRILELIYHPPHDLDSIIAELAVFPEKEWQELLARWDAIRDAQRAYILAHPGCIPDRLERQRWLSRLLAARPLILAAAEYARIRRTIEADDVPQPSRRSSRWPLASRAAATLAHGGSSEPTLDESLPTSVSSLPVVDPARPPHPLIPAPPFAEDDDAALFPE